MSTQINKDWLFVDGNKIFNYRSTGVLINDGKILIQRGVNDQEFALPGGHVKWGETSADALIREYREELNADVSIDRMIWVEEVFWKWGKRDAHTLCHYYLARLNNPRQIPTEGTFLSREDDESRLIFEWVDIGTLGSYKIYPSFLADKIMNLSDGIEHYISVET